jgi:putative flippase GtrA
LDPDRRKDKGYISKINSMILNLNSHKRIMKYIISGGTAAGVNFVFLYLFVDIAHIWYLFGSALSFIISFFVSFGLQKFFTFNDLKTDQMYKQMSKYLIVTLCGLGSNLILMWLFVDVLRLWYLLAQFFTSGIVAVFSYFAYREFIFNKK